MTGTPCNLTSQCWLRW